MDAICDLLTDSARWNSASEACRRRIEKGFTIQNMVSYFEREFCRLAEDSQAAEQRQHISEVLNLCTPMAAEVFTLEMQLQKTEDDLAWRTSHRAKSATSLWVKVRIELRERGLVSLLKKAVQYIRNRF